MTNWFTRLFTTTDTLLGRRVHAWSYGPYGRARVVGEVVGETEDSLTLDLSSPTQQDFRAFVHVWKHDMRPLYEDLPVDVTDVVGGMGT